MMSGREGRFRWIKPAAIVFTAVMVIFAVYAFIANTVVTTAAYDIASERIPAGFDGFRIVQISDLHNSRNTLMTDAMIRQVRELSPDVIFLTGDIIDRGRTDVNAAMNVLEKLNAIAPLYAVTGNHEARTEEYYTLSDRMRKLGVTELNDCSVSIRRGNDEMVILGLNDPRMVRKEDVTEADDTEARLNAIGFSRDHFSVLLTHRPELLDIYAAAKVDLVFAGHAHGGLIRLPFIGGLYAPHQGFFPEYVNGAYQKGTTTMIVSRGVGNTGHTFRINDEPEIVFATLHAQ